MHCCRLIVEVMCVCVCCGVFIVWTKKSEKRELQITPCWWIRATSSWLVLFEFFDFDHTRRNILNCMCVLCVYANTTYFSNWQKKRSLPVFFLLCLFGVFTIWWNRCHILTLFKLVWLKTKANFCFSNANIHKQKRMKWREKKKSPNGKTAAAYRPGNGTFTNSMEKGEGTRRKLRSCCFQFASCVPHDFRPLLRIEWKQFVCFSK